MQLSLQGGSSFGLLGRLFLAALFRSLFHWWGDLCGPGARWPRNQISAGLRVGCSGSASFGSRLEAKAPFPGRNEWNSVIRSRLRDRACARRPWNVCTHARARPGTEARCEAQSEAIISRDSLAPLFWAQWSFEAEVGAGGGGGGGVARGAGVMSATPYCSFPFSHSCVIPNWFSGSGSGEGLLGAQSRPFP